MAVLHAHDHRFVAVEGARHDIFPGEMAQLRQRVGFVIEKCDGQSAAAVEGRSPTGFFTREINRTIETLFGPG